MLFLFAFVVRHALSETVNCQSVNTVNQHADVTGVQPCTTPWESPSVPSLFFKKIAFPVQIGRQSFPLAKHQTDYPVSISLVTETHISMHILHNFLVVPVVVTCSAVCTSQYFTCLEHPNILQQTVISVVKSSPSIISLFSSSSSSKSIANGSILSSCLLHIAHVKYLYRPQCSHVLIVFSSFLRKCGMSCLCEEREYVIMSV